LAVTQIVIIIKCLWSWYVKDVTGHMTSHHQMPVIMICERRHGAYDSTSSNACDHDMWKTSRGIWRHIIKCLWSWYVKDVTGHDATPSSPIFAWLGVICLIEWALRHCDSHRRVHSASSTYFKLANCTHVAYR
jgi:hypothetical protein